MTTQSSLYSSSSTRTVVNFVVVLAIGITSRICGKQMASSQSEAALTDDMAGRFLPSTDFTVSPEVPCDQNVALPERKIALGVILSADG